MRYAPASRLSYSDEVAVPQLVSDFGAKLELIATHATDRAAALKMASARKGLANEYKRSVGKRVMMRKKKEIDALLNQIITADKASPALYNRCFPDHILVAQYEATHGEQKHAEGETLFAYESFVSVPCRRSK